jgi:hypothetical protein
LLKPVATFWNRTRESTIHKTKWFRRPDIGAGSRKQWLLFESVGLEFSPLSKPFKTKE